VTATPGHRFRRMALALTGAVEGAHMGHPDFRVNGRVFASLREDERTGMVKVTPDEQARLVREHPTAFAPEAGAWGRQGCTSVRIDVVDDETLGEALTAAWRAGAARPTSRRRASGTRR